MPRQIALLRLDGLGGTVTLSNQAKKIKELTGDSIVVIVRKYGELFKNNPYIDEIIEVGNYYWRTCFQYYRLLFPIICEFRYTSARWYSLRKGQIPNVTPHRGLQFIYDNHMKYRTPTIKKVFDTEFLQLNQSQMVDLSLGLDPTDIDIHVFTDQAVEVPDQYIVVNNGADEIHGGKRQSKLWPTGYWTELVKQQIVPVVQVGTTFDLVIPGVIDLRGKTSVFQLLYVLKKSTVIVCTEGGIMHLAYAVGARKVIVIQGPTAAHEYTYPSHYILKSSLCSGCWGSIPDWKWKCPLHRDYICMDSISPSFVNNSLQEILWQWV